MNVQVEYERRSDVKDEVKQEEVRKAKAMRGSFEKVINGATMVVYANYMKRGDAVVDLCCGPGTDLIKYWRLGISRVTGVDQAGNALMVAQKRWDELDKSGTPPRTVDGRPLGPKPERHWIQADLDQQNVTLPDRPGAVVCKNALHYFQNVPTFFSRVRALRPRIFIVLCLDADRLNQSVFADPPAWFRVSENTPTHYTLTLEGVFEHLRERKLYRAELNRLAHEAGFQLAQTRSVLETWKHFSQPFPVHISWPPMQSLTRQELALLDAYRFYVFC